MKVLVTGSSGHVGGAIARGLAARGHDVAGVSRRVVPYLPGAVRQTSVDLGTPGCLETIVAAVGPCDAVVHAAADLNKSLYAPGVTLTNGLGTQHMLQLAAQWSVRSFIYLSGVAVIGTPREHPITEGHPVAPLTAYHAAKLYGEHLTAVARRDGLNAVTLRLSAPAGPGLPAGRIMARFVERAQQGLPVEVNGQGTRRQNYVDVRDIASAVEACLHGEVSGLFNIGGAETVSNLELARRCVAATGSSSPIVFTGVADPDDDLAWDLSLDAARRGLGYEPAFTLEESIRACGGDA